MAYLQNALSRLILAIGRLPHDNPEELVRQVNRHHHLSPGPMCPLMWNAAGEPALQFGSSAAPALFVASLNNCAEAIEKMNSPYARSRSMQSLLSIPH